MFDSRTKRLPMDFAGSIDPQSLLSAHPVFLVKDPGYQFDLLGRKRF
jgi:hypothetical protein